MDRLTQMATFVKTVELGSFSAAADDLNLSPQLVGKQVKMLEQHLGVSLLHRTTRRQSLTDFGRAFYPRAKLILADMQSAENLAALTRGTPSGRLRINAPVTFGIRTLSPRLLEYMVRYPQVSVDLTLSNELVDIVDDGYDVSVHSKTSCHPADFRPRVTSHSTTRGYFHEKTPHRRTVASPNRSAA
jgi:DNA-binding transcriptional LysR family regulator